MSLTRIATVLTAIGLLTACSGRAGTGAEVFPESIALDISELPTDSTDTAAKGAVTAQSTEYVGVRGTIIAATTILNGFHNLADRALRVGRAITRDMDDPMQSQVQGTALVDGLVILYKADFSPFDIDGDGTPEGSGNAVDEPVAVRIWTDRGNGYEQFLCAVIGTKPTAANLGAGSMYARPGAAREDAYENFQFYAAWDRTDEAHRWNEAVLTGQVTEFTAMSAGLQRVDVRYYEDGHIEKTVRSNSNLTESLLGFEDYQFACHYEVLEPIVLVSAVSEGGLVQVDLDQVCVDVQAEQLAEGQCDAFDMQDFTYLGEPAGDEYVFPADFPETPTF